MADIALVVSSFLPRIGGVEEHVANVARGLRDRGHDVVVWTVDQGDDVPDAFDGIPIRVLPCPLPARNLRSLLWFAGRAPVAALRWLAALRRDRPRVLHVHCFGPNGVWGRAVARLSRTPLIVTSHGETFGDAHDSFGSSALLRGQLGAALREAAAVTACSDFTVRDLEARFGLQPGAARVVANGVDLDEAGGAVPPGLPARYLLAVGRVVPTKGFDLLLRAFAASALPEDVHLVIGGDGPQREELEALAAELGVTGRVRFAGRLDRGQVVSVTAGALGLVVPSRVESFGIVLLEGWRAGVPVIATTHGGPADIVRDGVDGLLADPLDTPALAAALDRIAADAPFAARIAAAGRARVAEFTWDRIVAEYEDVYRSAGVPDPPPVARRTDAG